jgi:hypothetical protein
MRKLRCTRYPQLLVSTPFGNVRFVDGVAEVDEDQAESILGLSAEQYGITVDDTAAAEAPAESDGDQVPPPPPDPKDPGDPDAPVTERPPKGAPKADWVAYADTQDPGDHSQMTKEQLIEQYGG